MMVVRRIKLHAKNYFFFINNNYKKARKDIN